MSQSAERESFVQRLWLQPQLKPCMGTICKMNSSNQTEIQAKIEKNVLKLENPLQRSDIDPRPVVLMMCGVAGRFAYR